MARGCHEMERTARDLGPQRPTTRTGAAAVEGPQRSHPADAPGKDAFQRLVVGAVPQRQDTATRGGGRSPRRSDRCRRLTAAGPAHTQHRNPAPRGNAPTVIVPRRRHPDRLPPPALSPPLASARAKAESHQEQEKVHGVALSLVGGILLLSAVLSGWLIADRPNAVGQTSDSTTQVGRYSCAYVRHGDLMLAGNSTTNSDLVALNSTGPDVAEVQCLCAAITCRRATWTATSVADGSTGEDPAATGPRLPDGIIGEQTWSLLRHVQ